MAIEPRNLAHNLRHASRYVVQRFERRTAPTWLLEGQNGIYQPNGHFPTFSYDPGSWYDHFNSGGETTLNSLGQTLRQYNPGTYAVRLDHPAAIVGGTIKINTRSGEQSAIADQTSTVSAAIWGLLDSDTTASVTIQLYGRNYWTGLRQTESITVTGNQPSSQQVLGRQLDLLSPWMRNMGTETDPQPRGWIGRFGTKLSKLAWKFVDSYKFLSKTVDLTGFTHGFSRFPGEFIYGPFAAPSAPPIFTPDNSRYYPEIFLHAHDPAYRCPWPSASLNQLLGVRITRGAVGSPMVSQRGEEGHPLVAGTSYLVFSESLARALDPPLDIDVLVQTGVVWIREPGNQDGQGDVWGITDADDPPAGGIYGNAPYQDLGTLIEAIWDPALRPES